MRRNILGLPSSIVNFYNTILSNYSAYGIITSVVISSLYTPILYAKSYWDSGSGYYESLSSLCDGVVALRSGNAEVCEVTPIQDGAPFGEFTGSCIIGDCDGIPLAYSYYTKELYTVVPTTSNNQPNMCTGNPIDPVTGNKLQREHLFEIEAIHPITFDLYYNSNRLEKWRHTFNRTLTFSSEPNEIFRLGFFKATVHGCISDAQPVRCPWSEREYQTIVATVHVHRRVPWRLSRPLPAHRNVSDRPSPVGGQSGARQLQGSGTPPSGAALRRSGRECARSALGTGKQTRLSWRYPGD